MPNTTSNNMPKKIAQITMHDLMIIEEMGGRLHTYRVPSSIKLSAYISNVQDMQGHALMHTLATSTQDIILYHLANKDNVICLL